MGNISNLSEEIAKRKEEARKHKVRPVPVDEYINLEKSKPISISESYILGFDISETDNPCLTVMKVIGYNKMTIVNQLQNNEVLEIYKKLIKKDPKGGNNNE